MTPISDDSIARLTIAPGQVFLLDVVRAGSAQAVLLGHAAVAVSMPPARYFPDLAVVLFLFVSGFLITHTALAHGKSYGIKNFLIDRGTRIFVPYLAAIVVIVAAGLAFNLEGPLHPLNILTSALMLQSYPMTDNLPFGEYFQPVGTGRPWWTVGVEWWFYWAFGFLFYLPKDMWKRLLFLALGIPGFFVVAVQTGSWVLAYPWLMGLVAACLLRLRPDSSVAAILIAPLFALCIARYTRHDDFYDLQGIMLVSALCIALLVAALHFKPPAFLATQARILSEYSYSLYLLNSMIIAVLAPWLPWNAGGIVMLVLAANIGSWLFAQVTERRHRGVRRWIRARMGLQPAPSGASA